MLQHNRLLRASENIFIGTNERECKTRHTRYFYLGVDFHDFQAGWKWKNGSIVGEDDWFNYCEGHFFIVVMSKLLQDLIL